MIEYDNFIVHYRQWLDDCLAEYNAGRYGDRFGPPRKYHQETVPEDYEPGELVEFAEDGDAYPHGIGGTGHIRGAVTPWIHSNHHVE